MRVTQRQESFDAFHFYDLEHLQDLIRFVRSGEDGLDGRCAKVEIDGRVERVTITHNGADIVVTKDQWVIRHPKGLQVLENSTFSALYQRAWE